MLVDWCPSLVGVTRAGVAAVAVERFDDPVAATDGAGVEGAGELESEPLEPQAAKTAAAITSSRRLTAPC
jgi:hypothetical protein